MVYGGQHLFQIFIGDSRERERRNDHLERIIFDPNYFLVRDWSLDLGQGGYEGSRGK